MQEFLVVLSKGKDRKGAPSIMLAIALDIEPGVSVDYVQAVLGISDARRLQSSGVVAGQLQAGSRLYAISGVGS